MQYHPYLDMRREDHISSYYQATVDWVKAGGSKRIEWTSHHTKQILIHAWLSDRIRHGYDVLVRTRFDAFAYSQAEFRGYLDDTMLTRRANCFGTTMARRFDNLYDPLDGLHASWMLDSLIIHSPDAIDRAEVDELHKSQKLHAAEFGWYQVISRPHGSTHRNHSGWVNPDHTVPSEFLAGQP